MIFKIETKKFIEAVTIVGKATIKNNLTPILENVLLQADSGQVKLIANNLDFAIEKNIEAEVIEPGATTLNFKELEKFVKTAKKSKSLQFSYIEWADSITVNTDFWSGEFNVRNTDKFPDTPKIEIENKIKFDIVDFKKGIDKTLKATASTDIRPMLAGICIKLEDNNIIFASTDSFRLSEYRIKDKFVNETNPIILPNKITKVLSDFAKKKTGEIEIWYKDNTAVIEFEWYIFKTRLLSGKFPDYQVYFPKNYNNKFTIDKKEFIDGLKTLKPFVKVIDYNIRITANENKIVVNSGNNENGIFKFEVPVAIEVGGETFGINLDYLLQAVEVIDGEKVTLDYVSPLSPIIVRDTGDENYTHLIMPLKI